MKRENWEIKPLRHNPNTTQSSQLTGVLLGAVFPLLLVLFSLLYLLKPQAYSLLNAKDEVVNSLTSVCWLFSALLFLCRICRTSRRTKVHRWYLRTSALFCLLAALDEVNWGQGYFGYSIPYTIAKPPGTSELSLHHILQLVTGIPVEKTGAILLLFLGCVLAVLVRRFPILKAEILSILPPSWVGVGLLLGGIAVISNPERGIQELGELIFSVSFLVLSVHNSSSVYASLINNNIRVLDLAYVLLGAVAITAVGIGETKRLEELSRTNAQLSKLRNAIRARDISSVATLLRGLPQIKESAAGASLIFDALKVGDTEIVREILKSGADPNQTNYKGTLPLNKAIELGNVGPICMLLEYDADPNKADSLGVSPLAFAMRHGNILAARALIAFGADQAGLRGQSQQLSDHLNTKRTDADRDVTATNTLSVNPCKPVVNEIPRQASEFADAAQFLLE